MKKGLYILMVAMVPGIAQAQLKGLMDRAKSKVESRINNKVDQSMDKTLDKVEGKTGAGGAAISNSEERSEGDAPSKKTVVSYSKFDFVPGERILYSEDFSQDVIGELPVNWNASGKGEVQTIEGKQGKWLRVFQNNVYLSGNTKTFGENFTVEFDMIYYFEPKTPGYVLPDINFGVLSTGDKDNGDNLFLKDRSYYNSTEITINPYGGGGARVASGKNRGTSFSSDRITLNDYEKHFNKVLHYSIQVQKTRLRMWINEAKIFDIPRAVNVGDTLNQLYFNLEGSNYKDEEIGTFISNIKIATGLPDTRHKLIEEGKFSTTGILFDVQSAVIKPESYGVVKEIATVLKENGSVKIKIIGHTSSDGDDAANLELSKQRAAAVKDLLVKEYGIEEERLKTEGKGETQPVGDNKTKEGKMQNRRVEFVKE
jgi:outer membrane protein OmpA-like peptidoglycan-associated protein